VGTSVFHPAKIGLVALWTLGLSREGAKYLGTVDSPTDMVTQPAATAAADRSGDRSSSHAASSLPKSTRSVPLERARAAPSLELTSVLARLNADAGTAVTAVGSSEMSWSEAFGPGIAVRSQT
jgi:hypothetical protein